MTPKAKTKKQIEVVTEKEIAQRIYLIRGQRIMLDRDLAEMYGVKTQVLNQAIKRNKERFPTDFMFSLTRGEIGELSHIVISSIKHAPNVNVFTENGVAMLSSILRSAKAIQVNIQIMRIFTRMRKIMASAEDIQQQIKVLEHQSAGHKIRIDTAFDAIRFLMEDKSKAKGK